MKQQATEKNMG